MKGEITDMQTGEVREVDIPDDLAEAMTRFLDDPEGQQAKPDGEEE